MGLLLKGGRAQEVPPPSHDLTISEWSKLVGTVHTNAVAVSISCKVRGWIEELCYAVINGEEGEEDVGR